MKKESPIIFESVDGDERGYDIYSRLLKDRIIFLTGPIDHDNSVSVIAQLILLDSQDPSSKIDLYIDSPGGYISSGLAIYDTMQYVRAKVNTICIGSAMSMAAIILAAGHKRYALPSATVMIHQGSSGFEGKADDVRIRQKELDRIEQLCNVVLSKHTGHSVKKLIKDQHHDKFMSAQAALEYNMIDKILEKRK